jgi:hypothetical protein
MTQDDCHYFGECPDCPVGTPTPMYRNIRSTHWFACDIHKVRWCPGDNLFSSWKEEDEASWAENYEILKDYEEVEHRPCSCESCLASRAVVESGR